MRYTLITLLLLTVSINVIGQTKGNILDYMDARVYATYPLVLKSEIKGIAQIGLGAGLYLTKMKKLGTNLDIDVSLYKLPSQKILVHQNLYIGLKYNLPYNAGSCFSPYLQVGYSAFVVSKNKSKGVGLSVGFEIYLVNIGLRIGYKKLFNPPLNFENGVSYPINLNILEFGLVYRFRN